LLSAAGWQPIRLWSDPDDLFMLLLAEARPAPAAP